MASKIDKKTLAHSAAHLLAHAVTELFPDTLLTIGPATQDGFFYDFKPTKNFKEEDLETITARMHALAGKKLPIIQTTITKAEALKLYHNNPFKLELINSLAGDEIGLSTQGDFYDLCKGGHVENTGVLVHFRLQAISGSYWRADRNGIPLQRISGIVFETADELVAYEKNQADIALYDHRRLGKQLDLFSFHDEGVGFPFFHAKGQRILLSLMTYMRQLHDEFGYEEIATPHLLTDELWRRSGHYANYKDNMYFVQIEQQSYALKPMNCPGSIIIFNNRPRSYRELPLRLAEFGHVTRHELSGVLHGLMRVRAFTQDDAHTYCTGDQLESEIILIIAIMKKMFARFGINDIYFAIATRPATKSIGSDLLWQRGTDALKDALTKLNEPFTIKEGDGAFYGPKIDVGIKDAMNRTWQCGTIQVDFFQPENFDITFINNKGEKERPIMIHHVIFGSLERFFGIILEHFKGALPFWLAPVQARIMTITQAQDSYAQELLKSLRKAGIRVEYEPSNDPINAHIKRAQEEKIPWMVIVGKKEMETQTVTLRKLDGSQEQNIRLEALIKNAQEMCLL
jgi:threonyl-tRNA synthetase